MKPLLQSLRKVGCIAMLTLGTTVSAQPIDISYYDINDAVLSGHGNWFHTYDGSITSGGNFTNFIPGTRAVYQGGSGTLNDGVIGGTHSSQLFVTNADDGTVLNPTLFLTLDTTSPWRVSKIEIYGGDITDNKIPGALTGVDVGVIGPSGGASATSFTTTGFGTTLNQDGIPVNDSIDLSNSIIATTPAWALVLNNFQGTVGNWFSITEIKVYGEPVSNVPLPASAWLMLSSLVGLLGLNKRKQSFNA